VAPADEGGRDLTEVVQYSYYLRFYPRLSENFGRLYILDNGSYPSVIVLK
jgi:hypothetical protein